MTKGDHRAVVYATRRVIPGANCFYFPTDNLDGAISCVLFDVGTLRKSSTHYHAGVEVMHDGTARALFCVPVGHLTDSVKEGEQFPSLDEALLWIRLKLSTGMSNG